MQHPEFIDTYSDDIIYLQEGRKALLTHPLRKEVKWLCDASFCRMFAVIMIGSLDAMLEQWRKRDNFNILEPWLEQCRGKHTPNSEKVRSLCNAFHIAGIKVDREVFEDFLAIKYLRNTIVHASLKQNEIKQLEQQGFPTDTRKLTEEHWRKMQSVNQNMMFYIALTGMAQPSYRPPEDLLRFKQNVADDDMGLVRKVDIPRIFWSNLEKISERIDKDMAKAALTEKYNWAKGLGKEEIKTMPDEEKKRLFFLALRRTGEENFGLLKQHQNLTKYALDSWDEYWRLTFDKYKISCEDITKCIEVFHSLEILENNEALQEKQIAFAFNTGRVVYDIMPNVTATYLLMVQLPIIDPENTHKYLEEGEKALMAIELHDYWYSYVESRSKPDTRRWAFYRRIRDEFYRR